MDMWKSESKPGKQMAAAILCALAGLALTAGFRDYSGPGMTDSKAGFLLGLLLLLIGILGLLAQGRQIVIVDPALRRITIKDQTLLGTKKRAIKLQDIIGIGIGFLGKRSNFVTCYYLVLKLKDGEEYSLFAPGRFYPGSSDRSIVEGWRDRLQSYIGAGVD